MCGHQHGVYPSRRADHGHALREPRPGDHLLSAGAKTDERRTSERSAQQEERHAWARRDREQRPPGRGAEGHRGTRPGQDSVETFCYRIRQYIGAYMAVMGGVDAVVFTAGIGENSDRVRAGVCGGMEGLGVMLDHQKNASLNHSKGEISTPREQGENPHHPHQRRAADRPGDHGGFELRAKRVRITGQRMGFREILDVECAGRPSRTRT